MGNGMNKVLPGLYVGNYRDSKDAVQLEKYKITHILSIHDAARRLHSICDSDLLITSVDPSFGGACHDSFIWAQHPLHEYLMTLQTEGMWLLGDSGYPLRRFLMTPIVGAPEGTPEAFYTDKHCKVRNVVERCIGVLKARWRCLLVHRVLHYKPEKAAKIVNACVVLHNLAVAAKLETPELTAAEVEEEISMQPDKHYLCIMASDSPDQNLTQYFSLCNDFIHAARLRDGNVLIHCLAGMSRSVTVAVAYIMSVTPLSWREALKVVRAGRAVANPNLGFQRQLQDFETYKLVEERRRLKERYPSLALASNDLSECRLMLDSYQTMLNERAICEGKCAMGRQCPTGVCRTGSKRQSRARRPSAAGGVEEDEGAAGGAGGLKRSPSTLSTTSTLGYRPRSSPAGLYSYTGVPSRPVRSSTGLSMTRVTDRLGGGSAMAVGGTEYSRRRAASAPATPAHSPATSPPGSPNRTPHRGGCTWIIPSVTWDPESM